MNILAEELNKTLDSVCAGRLLSETGLNMYFPKGILSQSAEANEKAHRFNATIGMAYKDGQPMILDAIKKHLPGLNARESVAYAPTSGVPALREIWKKAILRKNPSLAGVEFSLPLVVPGLTAGVSYLCDMFLNPGEELIVADMFWPNYRLIVESRRGGKLRSYKFFTEDGRFNIAGMAEAIRESAAKSKKALVVFNFPNNPSGYTPTLAEANEIVKSLKEIASTGIDILAISDDAYFGFQYEKDKLKESIFALLANAHENILAAKADGPTKEDYVWGFRGGFVSFAGKALDNKHFDALCKKLGGVVRSSISSSSAPSQYILLKAMEDPGYEKQKKEYEGLLSGRYHAVKAYLASHPVPEGMVTLPFNSGYFMCFECKGFSAEALRLKLLDEGVGTISIQEKWLRVAFSACEEKDIPQLYDAIFDAARSIMKK